MRGEVRGGQRENGSQHQHATCENQHIMTDLCVCVCVCVCVRE